MALAGLASAAGRAKDLLLLVKLLLGIGHPRPSSSREAQGNDDLCGFASAPASDQFQHGSNSRSTTPHSNQAGTKLLRSVISARAIEYRQLIDLSGFGLR